MSAMDFKKNTDLDFPSYATPAVSTKEIDLLGLLDILLAAKKRIMQLRSRLRWPDWRLPFYCRRNGPVKR